MWRPLERRKGISPFIHKVLNHWVETAEGAKGEPMFEVAEAYEVRTGRWSRQLAPLFVKFVGVEDGDKVLDVGCGTGSLSATLAKVTGTSKIVGIDPSKGFIDYARTQIADPRVIFEVGDAQDLPYPDFSFDRCMALLAVDWIPDARKAAIEMRRVTKTAGVVATTMWDRSRANELDGSRNVIPFPIVSHLARGGAGSSR